jgi:hypothetical protein
MQDWNDHKRLANRLAQTKCKWILSSYDAAEVHQMYEGYNIIPVQTYSGMNVKKNGSERVVNREVLITNFDTETSQLLTTPSPKAIVQPTLLSFEE